MTLVVTVFTEDLMTANPFSYPVLSSVFKLSLVIQSFKSFHFFLGFINLQIPVPSFFFFTFLSTPTPSNNENTRHIQVSQFLQFSSKVEKFVQSFTFFSIWSSGTATSGKSLTHLQWLDSVFSNGMYDLFKCQTPTKFYVFHPLKQILVCYKMSYF